jgi:hypothetical protein
MASMSEFNRFGEEIERFVVSQLRMFEERKMGYRYNALWEVMHDFPRPDFYKKFYRECGLEADDVPTWPAH